MRRERECMCVIEFSDNIFYIKNINDELHQVKSVLINFELFVWVCVCVCAMHSAQIEWHEFIIFLIVLHVIHHLKSVSKID